MTHPHREYYKNIRSEHFQFSSGLEGGMSSPSRNHTLLFVSALVASACAGPDRALAYPKGQSTNGSEAGTPGTEKRLEKGGKEMEFANTKQRATGGGSGAQRPLSDLDPLSTHVLDTTSGLPGKGVNISLMSQTVPEDANSWLAISEKYVFAFHCRVNAN